jgi:hypothetical protein
LGEKEKARRDGRAFFALYFYFRKFGLNYRQSFWVVDERCAFGEERNLPQRRKGRKGWNGVGFGSGIFQSHPSVAWMGHPRCLAVEF